MERDNEIYAKHIYKNKKIFKFFSPVFHYTLTILVFSLFFLFVIGPCVALGSSMSPTIKAGSICCVRKVCNNFDYGDVVLAHSPTGEKVIKRIIACPGDSVLYKDGKLFVNGKEEQDLFAENMDNLGILADETILRNDEYILLGDNRNNSVDSRVFGPLKKETFIGEILFL